MLTAHRGAPFGRIDEAFSVQRSVTDSPPPPRSAAAKEWPSQLVFYGEGWEYFRVWIANVALTLATLGLYSPWAKVRTRRYLYANTYLGNESFDFTADPVSMLPGRLIAVALIATLWVADLFSPLVYGFSLYYFAGLLAFAPILPWVVVRARSFNLRHTRWRNVAFAFHGSYRDAALWYPLAIVAGFASLGLAWPWLRWRREEYLTNNSSFGLTQCRLVGDSGAYYGAYAGSAGIVIGLMLPFAYIAGRALPSVGTLGTTLIMFAPIFLASVYVSVRIANYRWSNTTLGGTRFRLRLSVTQMFWLYMSNMVLIAATAGLFIPFARLRVFRYRLSRFEVFLAQDMATFQADPAASPSAMGAAISDGFEIDVGA